MNTPFGVLCALTLGLSACSTYTSSPVDLSRDTAQWLSVSQQLSTSSLKRAQLHRIGLLLNPELNAKRLTYAKSTSVSKYAGLWSDPALGVELGRNLTESLNNYALAPSITIPVTGLPRLAKQIAEQYRETDYWNMRAAERDYLSSIEQLRIDLLLNQRKESLINQRLKQLRRESKKITQLHAIGESSFAEKQIAQQRLNDLITEHQNTQDSVLTARLDLVRELGLHPSTHRLRVSDDLPQSTPSSLGAPSASALLDAPQLKASAAELNASELELKREIRKQYPELALSPSFAREDGEKGIGLGFELSIPLWNRNREAIANSTGERALKAHAYISAWRRLLTDAQALAQQERLSITHCRSEMARINELQQATSTQEQLHALGELSLAELSEMRHESFQRELSLLEHLTVLLKTQAKLRYMNPHHNI